MGDWLSSLKGAGGSSGAASGTAASSAASTGAAPAASSFMNDYYKPFIAGGQQSFSDAWKGMGNNPQTYGYVARKLEDFSKMAPPLPPAQMSSMPTGQPRRQQPEDSFTQLMRFRRRG